MNSKQDWKDLSQEDRFTKAKALGKALVDNELAGANIQMIEQHIVSLDEGVVEQQNVLVIDGSVSAKQASNLKAFNEAAKGILDSVNPKTAVN